MSRLRSLRSTVLQDRKITLDEVEVIRDCIRQDGKLDLDDVRILVELLTDATEVCREFDELFFPVLKEVVLADGRIGFDEQFYLLKMLYSDGHVRPSERLFLAELRREATETTPEFDALCETAARADDKNWDLGGRPR